jgi:hypothetical protein
LKEFFKNLDGHKNLSKNKKAFLTLISPVRKRGAGVALRVL